MNTAADAPRGGVVETPAHFVDPFEFLKSGKDRLAWFNRSVRPILFAGLGLAFILLAMGGAFAFVLALFRSAYAQPVGDMSLGILPLVTAALPLLLHMHHRHSEKREGVAG